MIGIAWKSQIRKDYIDRNVKMIVQFCQKFLHKRTEAIKEGFKGLRMH